MKNAYHETSLYVSQINQNNAQMCMSIAYVDEINLFLQFINMLGYNLICFVACSSVTLKYASSWFIHLDMKIHKGFTVFNNVVCFVSSDFEFAGFRDLLWHSFICMKYEHTIPSIFFNAWKNYEKLACKTFANSFFSLTVLLQVEQNQCL